MKENSRDMMDSVIKEVLNAYDNPAISLRCDYEELPSKSEIIRIIGDFLRVMLPGYFDGEKTVILKSEDAVERLLHDTYYRLKRQVMLALAYKAENKETEKKAQDICDAFIAKLPEIQRMLLKDVTAGFDGDPAAQSKEEIVFCYPGFYATAVYRLAHEMYLEKVPLIPRVMTEYAHTQTGIDINAGATIGESFFIDHGTGVVIGETAVIGNYVKIYQGVTLGALSTRPGQALAGVRRHPTVEDGVTIYSGASVLGGETVVGENSVIGGNCFIVSSIPKNTKVSAKLPELTLRNSENKA